MTLRSIAIALLCCSLSTGRADDWSEWRGPHRNGALKDSPPLLDSAPDGKLEILWEVALPPRTKAPYYSSPVGADGKAFLHFSPGAKPPPPPPPPKVEVKEKEEEDDLDDLLGEPKPPKKPPPKPPRPPDPGMDDVLLCVDLNTGKELWRFKQPGGPSKLGAPNTACIDGGKAFFLGNLGRLYCVDTGTGNELWRAEPGERKSSNYTASPTVLGDNVIVVDRKMFAFKTADGAKVWEAAVAVGHGSPTLWEKDGKTYLIANGQELFCVDSTDGKIVWKTEGIKTAATPAIGNDRMVLGPTYGTPAIYELTLEGPKKTGGFQIQPAGLGHQACTASVNGNLVYLWGRAKTHCYDLDKKAIVWQGESVGDGKPSPILADGKVICNSGRKVLVLDASDGKTLISAAVGVASCTSCGLVDGKLLVNAASHFRCYNLAKK